MDIFGFNILALALATLCFLAVGFLWYGPIFGKAWLALSQKTPDDFKGRGWTMPLGIFNSFVTALVMAVIFGWIGVDTISAGIKTAFVLWLGISATTQLLAFIWEAQPIKLTAIHLGNQLLAMLAAGAILGWL